MLLITTYLYFLSSSKIHWLCLVHCPHHHSSSSIFFSLLLTIFHCLNGLSLGLALIPLPFITLLWYFLPLWPNHLNVFLSITSLKRTFLSSLMVLLLNLFLLLLPMLTFKILISHACILLLSVFPIVHICEAYIQMGVK